MSGLINDGCDERNISHRNPPISDWWLCVKFARDFHKIANLIGDKREIKTSLVIKPAAAAAINVTTHPRHREIEVQRE